MSYTNSDNVIAAYPDAQGKPSVGWAIAHADAEINGRIGGRYIVPIVPTPPLLEKIATELAGYMVLTSQAFTAPPRPIETGWENRYKAAVAMLMALATGEMVLTDATGAVVPQNGVNAAAWSNTMGFAPTFYEGRDQIFRVDPNKIDAEESKRL